MTIKKIALSLAAIAVVSTSTFASGTLELNITANSNQKTEFSNELISVKDTDYNKTDNAYKYTCGIKNSSASEPGFELKLLGDAEITGTNEKISIYKESNSSKIATFDRYDKDTHSIIFKSVSGTSITRGATYVIAEDENGSTTTNDIDLTIKKGAKVVKGELIITDNTGTNVIDTATGILFKGADQFKMTIDNPFSAKIDASKSFKEFYSSNTNNNLSDSIKYTIANIKGDLLIPALAGSIKVNIVADQNLSAYKMTLSSSKAGINQDNIADPVLNKDYNITANNANNKADTNFSSVITSKLTTDKTGAMSVTKFKATGIVKFNTNYSKTLLDKVNAGIWEIYGYKAQIPNVTGAEGFETVIKFTNRSSIAADIFFTLIDPEGNVVELNSKDTTLSSIAKNATGTYKASDLIKLIPAGKTFDSKTSFSVEVTIPTSPNKIYGMASFKNKTLGQFKDLPVYNSSEMAY